MGRVERWCLAFLSAPDLAAKLDPSPWPDTGAPDAFGDDAEESRVPLRIHAASRPAPLVVVARSPGAPRPEALTDKAARARLLHTFLHHEMQAAELFAWAVLAFPDAPRAFRAGLVRLCREELEHAQAYRVHLRAAGADYGDHPVRDWFWQRVSRCESAVQFVALQGLGLEGANLEHTARYAAHARALGDEDLARTFEHVEADEIGHVAFARTWFERFTGRALDYDAWRAALPEPLTPAVLQGKPLNLEARRRAGLDDVFLARLASEPPTSVARPTAKTSGTGAERA